MKKRPVSGGKRFENERYLLKAGFKLLIFIAERFTIACAVALVRSRLCGRLLQGHHPFHGGLCHEKMPLSRFRVS